MSSEEKFRQMAAQLRKPVGESGIETAKWMARGNAATIHDTFRALNISDGDHILEIGMADGFYVNDLMKRAENLSYTGLDFSATMVAEAVMLNASLIEKGRVNFVLSGAANMPLPDETFDRIFTINTIYFWDDELSCLREMKRVLKPAGKIVIAFRPKHQSEQYPFTKYGFNQFSREDVITMLEANSLHVENVFENQEADLELDDRKIKMGNLVIVASKMST